MADGTLDTRLIEAPYFADVAPGIEGQAFWGQTSDRLRVRLGVWRPQDTKGTVLLFPGRTEYIEKYAQIATELGERGHATIAIDWRGQGLADRLLPDKRIGHVGSFLDYQLDVAALLETAETLDLPRPWYLLGHSMGGCIGLRSLIDDLPVKMAAFTGPMWGIRIAPHLRPLAMVLKHLMPAVGLGHLTPPTTQPEPYVLQAPFEGNMLTRNREMWDMMYDQLKAHPDLSLGGPSIIWLREALAECNALAHGPAPDCPCVAYLGTQERIVHVGRIHERMESWPNGHLDLVEGAEHEVLMEGPDLRAKILDDMIRRFQAA